jgi:hypothetical protein
MDIRVRALPIKSIFVDPTFTLLVSCNFPRSLQGHTCARTRRLLCVYYCTTTDRGTDSVHGYEKLVHLLLFPATRTLNDDQQPELHQNQSSFATNLLYISRETSGNARLSFVYASSSAVSAPDDRAADRDTNTVDNTRAARTIPYYSAMN